MAIKWKINDQARRGQLMKLNKINWKNGNGDTKTNLGRRYLETEKKKSWILTQKRIKLSLLKHKKYKERNATLNYREND